MAKIRLKLRKKAEAQIAARTFEHDLPLPPASGAAQDLQMTGASRESETTYSKDSIAILEKTRVSKFNKDHQFDLLKKSTHWIKT